KGEASLLSAELIHATSRIRHQEAGSGRHLFWSHQTESPPTGRSARLGLGRGRRRYGDDGRLVVPGTSFRWVCSRSVWSRQGLKPLAGAFQWETAVASGSWSRKQRQGRGSSAAGGEYS